VCYVFCDVLVNVIMFPLSHSKQVLQIHSRFSLDGRILLFLHPILFCSTVNTWLYNLVLLLVYCCNSNANYSRYIQRVELVKMSVPADLSEVQDTVRQIAPHVFFQGTTATDSTSGHSARTPSVGQVAQLAGHLAQVNLQEPQGFYV
jgi:hypothetical protein